MRKFYKVVLRVIKYITVLLLAGVFVIGIIILPMLLLENDTDNKPSPKVDYKQIELSKLIIGMPYNEETLTSTVLIAGYSGDIIFFSNYDKENPKVKDIFFSSEQFNIDTLSIQKVIKEIEGTFNIEFNKAPMECDVDLFAIKENVEFDLYWVGSSGFIFWMKHRFD